LPYTIIDVGWWFQFTLPKLPSGRIDYAHSGLNIRIPGDGNVLSAFTDNRDIGKLVARTIADPRTLNQQVFLYSEMTTLTKVYDLLEKISGEDVPRDYVSSLPQILFS
jgi:nucleoside-diphosphate-sugar epimerase